MKNIVITGGAGFIGSHVVRLFVNKYFEYNIINLDKLVYAENLAKAMKEVGGSSKSLLIMYLVMRPTMYLVIPAKKWVDSLEICIKNLQK